MFVITAKTVKQFAALKINSTTVRQIPAGYVGDFIVQPDGIDVVRFEYAGDRFEIKPVLFSEIAGIEQSWLNNRADYCQRHALSVFMFYRGELV